MNVDELYEKAKARTLTAAACAELLAASTEQVGPHPPHPHAHIAQDGFERDENAIRISVRIDGRDQSVGLEALEARKIWLRARLNTKYGKKGPPAAHADWKREWPRVLRAIDNIHRQFMVAEMEGRHLDPGTYAEFPAESRLTQQPVPQYIDRAVHSQFEDSEVAVMALFYALNSPAGQDALYQIARGWGFGQRWTRSSVHSKTAARGLALGSVARAGGPRELSEHAKRTAQIRMIERGKGPAGNAPTPEFQVGGVVSVLHSDDGIGLRVVTHYPVQNHAPKVNPPGFTGVRDDTDFVDLRYFPPPGGAKRPSTIKAHAAATPTRMNWGDAPSDGFWSGVVDFLDGFVAG